MRRDCSPVQATCGNKINAMKSVTISNREIATMAFDRLCKENKTDAAIRLAHAMLHSQSICLGLGDMEWEYRSHHPKMRWRTEDKLLRICRTLPFLAGNGDVGTQIPQHQKRNIR